MKKLFKNEEGCMIVFNDYTNEVTNYINVDEVDVEDVIAEFSAKYGFTEKYRRQYRDYADDCNIRETTCFSKVHRGTVRYSGHTNALLVNPSNDQYVEFNFNSAYIYRVDDMLALVKNGFSEYYEKTQNYRR